jgi:predicted DNA-binding protein
MSNKSVRRSLAMTPEMAQRLKQIVTTKPRNITEADLIREAIRLYLDQQDDLIGSRRHFQRTFRSRIDQLEEKLTFQMTVILLLLAVDNDQMQQAIIAARKYGDTLLAQMDAVRNLEIDE